MTVVLLTFPGEPGKELVDQVAAVDPSVEVIACEFRPVPEALTELTDEQRSAFSRAEVMLALAVPKAARELAPNLRWVQGIGAGVDHLREVDFAEGVVVTNAVGVAAVSIAEFALARLLAIWKRFQEIAELQRNHDWRPSFGRTLQGSTVAVVGLGAIGTAFAERAHALGMRVLATRRNPGRGDDTGAVDEVLGPDRLHEVLGRSDAVLVSAPATPETEDLFDTAAFAAMKPGAVFVNVGRGSLVDEAALIAALESGHLGAAAIDVAKQEPLPPEDPLWDAPNLHISPHSSASLDRYVPAVYDLFADNLGRYVRGEPLRNVVDLATGY